MPAPPDAKDRAPGATRAPDASTITSSVPVLTERAGASARPSPAPGSAGRAAETAASTAGAPAGATVRSDIADAGIASIAGAARRPRTRGHRRRGAVQVDGGRFPAKCIAGEPTRLVAHCFADGHDQLRVMLSWRAVDGPEHASGSGAASRHERRMACQRDLSDPGPLCLHGHRLGRRTRPRGATISSAAWTSRTCASPPRSPRTLLTQASPPRRRFRPARRRRHVASRGRSPGRRGAHAGARFAACIGARRNRAGLCRAPSRSQPGRVLPGTRAGGRPPARPLLELVRIVPALGVRRAGPPRHVGRRRAAPALRRVDGLRRVVPAADPSHRPRDVAKAGTTRWRRRTGTSAVPGRSGPSKAAISTSIRPSARWTISVGS